MSGPGSDYQPSGREKGHAPYDIAQILTRHHTGTHPCAKVLTLRLSAGHGRPADERLAEVHATGCTCGAGHSDSEYTTDTRNGNPPCHTQHPLLQTD